VVECVTQRIYRRSIDVRKLVLLSGGGIIDILGYNKKAAGGSGRWIHEVACKVYGEKMLICFVMYKMVRKRLESGQTVLVVSLLNYISESFGFVMHFVPNNNTCGYPR
jgi:hypothetical protein